MSRDLLGSLVDYPSSYDIDQRNPDPNKRAVLELFRKRGLGQGTPFCAPVKHPGRWGIWANMRTLYAQGRTPQEAWANALRQLGGKPATVSNQRPHHSGAL